MIDTRILVILIVLSGGYYIGEKVVESIKKVDTAVAHVVKTAAVKTAHGAKKVGHVLNPCIDQNHCLF